MHLKRNKMTVAKMERKKDWHNQSYLGDLPSLFSWPITPWKTTAWSQRKLFFKFLTVSLVTSIPHAGWNIKDISSLKWFDILHRMKSKKAFGAWEHTLFRNVLWYFVEHWCWYDVLTAVNMKNTMRHHVTWRTDPSWRNMLRLIWDYKTHAGKWGYGYREIRKKQRSE